MDHPAATGLLRQIGVAEEPWVGLRHDVFSASDSPGLNASPQAFLRFSSPPYFALSQSVKRAMNNRS
jgi:hypothetical protein